LRPSASRATQATGQDAAVLVEAISGWIGSEGRPFGLLGDGGRLSGLDAEAADERPAAVEAVPALEATETILLAEDDEAVRGIAVLALSRAGYEVLAAFFTSSAIRASTAAVSFVTAKETGHISPSSRLASGWNSKVAYLTLNFEAGLKKQITLPSLAYAGIP
jgi:hypothetical protein